jgi:nicotinamide-nucleotide amidase
MTLRNQAEIISIGTEILMGEIVDTNAIYLATQLKLLGNELARITIVGDDHIQLCQVLKQALERANIVLTSGGLGPTEDDITRECLAEVLGERLAVDEESEKGLRDLFRHLGREMPAQNVRQAMLIPSAKPLRNKIGTAPGWWVVKGGKIIITLPGPPRELKPMWENEVRPRLQLKYPAKPILTRTLKTYGLAEAKVAEMVKPFDNKGNFSLGFYARRDGIHLRLISRGGNSEESLEEGERQLEKLLDGYIWGKDDDTLPGIIGRVLIENGLSLATMEVGTHGFVASIISSVDRSVEYYRGGLVVGTEEMQVSLGLASRLLTQYGAISAEVAEAMAALAKEKFSADIGLSITAIERLDSQEGNRPGLAYVGLADNYSRTSWRQSNLPYQDVAREWLAMSALFRLRERLI